MSSGLEESHAIMLGLVYKQTKRRKVGNFYNFDQKKKQLTATLVDSKRYHVFQFSRVFVQCCFTVVGVGLFEGPLEGPAREVPWWDMPTTNISCPHFF